ncbi:MAG: carboxylesterase [Pseudomonadota bacterium]
MIRNEDAITLPPQGKHRATVVWLHGLGADGNDFVPIVPELGLPKDHGIKFIFPHASVRPVTLNNGYPMRAWYDIVGLSRTGPQDTPGIRDSAQRIAGILDAEMAAGIPSSKLVIAGFSQGCAMALHTGLRFHAPLAGIVGLSGYLPVESTLAAEAHAENLKTPILLVHGKQDPVVPYSMGSGSRDVLVQLGYPVQWLEYPMQHQVVMEEIEEVGAFLRARLA